VGTGTGFFRPILEPSTEVPSLVSVTTEASVWTHSPTIDRRDTTPHEAILSPAKRESVGPPSRDIVYELVIGSTVYRGTLEELGNHPDSRLMTSPTTVLAPDTIVSDEDEDVSILGDIYDVVDTTLGGWLPGGVAPGSGHVTGPIYQQPIVPVVVNQTPQVQAPVVFPTGGVQVACDNDPMKGMVYKKVCGEYRWVKQKYRRRKALVTQSDLKGLAALKGVLGGGKAFETWIATHS